jgi:hypothetical protein
MIVSDGVKFIMDIYYVPASSMIIPGEWYANISINLKPLLYSWLLCGIRKDVEPKQR